MISQPSYSYDKDNIKVEEVSIDGGAKRALTSANTSAHSAAAATNAQAEASLGVRILKGKSLVTLSNVLSREEIDYLVKSSLEAAADQQPAITDDTTTCTSNSSDRVCVRMPTRAAAHRQDIPDANNLHDPLPDEVSQFVEERILERILHYMDSELCPSVKRALFGDDNTNMLTLFQTKAALEWSNREPAVNVYYPPNGYFGLHKDNKALTILMPLTSRDDDDDDDDDDNNNDSTTFTGGGTAFWSQSHPKEGIDGPSLVMAPKAGTALLFGGQVYHKGLSIETGHRVVFVASFSKRELSRKKSKTWMVSAR